MEAEVVATGHRLDDRGARVEEGHHEEARADQPCEHDGLEHAHPARAKKATEAKVAAVERAAQPVDLAVEVVEESAKQPAEGTYQAAR